MADGEERRARRRRRRLLQGAAQAPDAAVVEGEAPDAAVEEIGEPPRRRPATETES